MSNSESYLAVTTSDRGKEHSRFLATYSVCKNKTNQYKNTFQSQILSSFNHLLVWIIYVLLPPDIHAKNLDLTFFLNHSKLT